MFTVSSLSLPTSLEPQGEGAVIAIVKTGALLQGALLAVIGSSQPTQAIALTLPPYEGNTAQIDVGSLEFTSVQAVEIAGIRYTASNTLGDLQPGQFFWDSLGGKIKVQFDAQ